jgi:fructose-specific component phosphotransferase system IIB-like protein
MVFEAKLRGKKVFACGVCRFAYTEKELAEKCQAHCAKYNACSLAITKNAIGKV